MKGFAAALALSFTVALGGCATLPAGPASPVIAEQREPVTILVSIDGFRADYLQRGFTPVLAGLADAGVSAAMRPSFPSKTFPNHWASVTGYVPDRSGIVANGFTDPARPAEMFSMASTDPFYWNAKEPIWVTAERAGTRTAAMFWPGSAVAWGGSLVPGGYGRVEGGIRPQDWTAFDQNVSPTQRVNTIIDWLRRPADIRPKLLFLYFDEVDTAGHDGGPDSAVLNQALRNVDEDIGNLLADLRTLGQPVNLVVTADHGMAETSNARTVELDKLLPREDYVLVEQGPYATLNAVPGKEAVVEKALLRKHERMECWRKSEIPARFQYGTSNRIPAYLCLAQTGWQINQQRREGERIGGNHGFDPFAREMAALFIANGPAFHVGKTIPTFRNVSVNSLLRAVLGLPQNPDADGSLSEVSPALAPED